jgi:hypothetical protein
VCMGTMLNPLWILYSAAAILEAALPPAPPPIAPSLSYEEIEALVIREMVEESYRDHHLWIWTYDGPRVLEINIALMDNGDVSNTVFTGYLGDNDVDDVVEWYKPGPWCDHFTQVAARAVAVLQDRPGGLEGRE